MYASLIDADAQYVQTVLFTDNEVIFTEIL